MLYVCGGTYRKEGQVEPQFCLVSPSGNSLPYVEANRKAANRLFHLCQHHSHLYSVDDSGRELTLVTKGTISVHAPQTHTLTLKQANDVRKSAAQVTSV